MTDFKNIDLKKFYGQFSTPELEKQFVEDLVVSPFAEDFVKKPLSWRDRLFSRPWRPWRSHKLEWVPMVELWPHKTKGHIWLCSAKTKEYRRSLL